MRIFLANTCDIIIKKITNKANYITTSRVSHTKIIISFLLKKYKQKKKTLNGFIFKSIIWKLIKIKIHNMYWPELSFTFIKLLLFNIVIRGGSLQYWDVWKILSLEILKLNADLLAAHHIPHVSSTFSFFIFHILILSNTTVIHVNIGKWRS